MKQKEIRTIPQVLDASATAIAAATATGAAVGLKNSTAEVMTTERNALVTANNGHKEAKVALDVQRATYLTVFAMVILFVTKLRDVLRAHIGTRHNNSWDALGFVGSLAIPRTVTGLRYILEQAKAYLAAHQTHQNTELNITATRVDEVLTELNSAANALKTARTLVSSTKATRDAKFTALVKRVRYLFAELKTLLDPMDALFEQYGFKRPGAEQISDVPENVMAVLIGPNAASVKWAGAPRAEYYRVWKKVVGLDEELVPAGSPGDLDFTIENLPANSTIEIAVSAVNSGGESAKSAVVTIQTT